MSIDFRTKAELHDYLLKQKRMVMEVSIKANATPASKTVSSDVNGAVVLRTQGLTATADAIESLTGQVTAPDDATGKFAILIDDQCAKFLKATVTPSAGTIAVSKSISTGGRMILDCDSNQDLSTTDLTLLVEIEYRTK